MTQRPWMPMYWADYRHDTAHLTTEEDGAYLLLIAYYWTHGHLPNSPKEAQTWTKLGKRKYERVWAVLSKFFDSEGRHKRIDAEIRRFENIRQKRAIAGQMGGMKSAGHTNMNRAIARANATLAQVANAQANGPLTTVINKKETSSSLPLSPAARSASALPSGAPRSPPPVPASKPNGKAPHAVTRKELEAIYAVKKVPANPASDDDLEEIPF